MSSAERRHALEVRNYLKACIQYNNSPPVGPNRDVNDTIANWRAYTSRVIGRLERLNVMKEQKA